MLLLALIAGCSPHEVPDDLADTPPEAYAADRVVVGIGSARSWALRTRHGTLSPDREILGGRVGVYPLPPGVDVLEVVAELGARTDLAFAEPDFVRTVAWVPDDPLYPEQWNFDLVDAEGAWAVSTGAGVRVAVVDTGVSTGGRDTPAMAPGWDFVDGDDAPADGFGHGTHVAGTIAQATDNAYGLAGLAPDAVVMPVRVLDDNGFGTSARVAAGIAWATDHGAQVINVSIAAGASSDAEILACDDAAARGAIVVAAAGNNGWDTKLSAPGRYPSVLAVGAVGVDRTRTWYSNGGRDLDLVAPGGDLTADLDGDRAPDGVVQESFDRFGTWKFIPMQGTSMATPHVSATAALLVSMGATPAEVRGVLLGHAVDLGIPGYDWQYGHGLLDAAAAVEAYAAGDLGLYDPPPELGAIDVAYDRLMLRVAFDTTEPTWARLCDDAGACVTDEAGVVTRHALRLRTTGATWVVQVGDEGANRVQAGPYALP